jgi:transposase
MLTVDDFGRIRRAHRDGMSIREIARRFHHAKYRVREILRGDESEPEPYSPRKTQTAPKLGAFHERILEILRDDEDQPPKQRHTAMRIFERLRDEAGYSGGYDSVRRFVKRQRRSEPETFIPLDHAPGQRVEADFGEIVVDFPDGRRKVNVLILVWSYSNAPFAIALPTQRTEAILEGMTQAFEFFGCVPKEVWWDNPRTVAQVLLVGRERKLNPRYAALASHFVFDPLFCLPARGNEKPVVENRVKTLERKWSTPVPRVENLAELNASLRERCVRDRERPSSGKTETIGVRFEQDRAASAPLPRHRFDACVRQEAKVDKYQFARFDNVSYSVPRHCAFQAVTVKGYVDRVEIIHQHTVVATHERSYVSGDQLLDPRHYLTTLQRRPAALDHANVYRNWKLPAVFAELRGRLEERHGVRSGVRQYVRVLQLLASHPQSRVQSAIEQLRGPEGADADRIIRRVERSAARARQAPGDSRETSPTQSSLHEEGLRDEVLSVQVPVPDLHQFDRLLSTPPVLSPQSQGSTDDELREEDCQRREVAEHDHEADNRRQSFASSGEERCTASAAEVQSQATAAADDECRVPATGPGSGGLESDLRAVPAAAHGTGSRSPGHQHTELADQAGAVPGAQRPGQLRLLGTAFGQQTESPGTRSLRLDHSARQCLSARPARHWENAFVDRTWPGRLP